jgi:hypothetical protein
MSYFEAEYLPYHIKAIPLIFSHLGIFIAYHTTSFWIAPAHGAGALPSLSKGGMAQPTAEPSLQKSVMLHEFQTLPTATKIYGFFNRKWYIDEIYGRFLIQKVLDFGYQVTFRLFDAG